MDSETIKIIDDQRSCTSWVTSIENPKGLPMKELGRRALKEASNRLDELSDEKVEELLFDLLPFFGEEEWGEESCDQCGNIPFYQEWAIKN